MPRMISPRRTSVGLLLGLATIPLISACSPVVTVEAAADAANAGCAPMMVILPQYVADFPRRETSSQATAAWGDPSQVILRCGVQVPGPTTDQCVSVDGVDWVLREGEDGYWTATTYGRNPATELIFKPDDVAESSVLMDLSAAASKIPQERECLSISDVL